MLSQFPSKIRAGLSLSVDLVSEDHPAPAWSALVILRGPGSEDFASVAEGTAHRVALDAATTSALAPGLYDAEVRLTDGASVVQLEAGVVTVVADLAQVAAGHDARRHAEKVLEAIEAVIEGRASKDQQSYTIGNRSLVRTPLAELTQLRREYRAEVARLKAEAEGRPRSGRILGRQIKTRW